MNEDQKEGKKLEIYIPNGPRLGTNVIDPAYRRLSRTNFALDDLNFPSAAGRGIAMGIIRPNGAGKNDLFHMIIEIQPDSGTFEVGKRSR